MAKRGIKNASFLSDITTPLNNEMAMMGLKLAGKVIAFKTAANIISAAPMNMLDL